MKTVPVFFDRELLFCVCAVFQLQGEYFTLQSWSPRVRSGLSSAEASLIKAREEGGGGPSLR